MAYAVRLRPSVRKELKRLPGAVYDRAIVKILSLAENPRPHGSKKLVGEKDTYRLRVGDYRIVYKVNDAERTLRVTRIGHRQGVYD